MNKSVSVDTLKVCDAVLDNLDMNSVDLIRYKYLIKMASKELKEVLKDVE